MTYYAVCWTGGRTGGPLSVRIEGAKDTETAVALFLAMRKELAGGCWTHVEDDLGVSGSEASLVDAGGVMVRGPFEVPREHRGSFVSGGWCVWQLPTVYLVHGQTGQGGDTQVWCVGAFMSRDEAAALAKRANDWLEERSALGGWPGTKVSVGYERRVEVTNARPEWLLGLTVDHNGAYFAVSKPVSLHAADKADAS